MMRRSFLGRIVAFLAAPFVAKRITTRSNWTAYTTTYTNVSKADMLQAMRRAMDSMDFEPPLGDDYVELKGNIDATGGLDGQH